MREIHFRGICKDSKRWAYGYYVHFEDFSQGINYHGICSGYYNTHFEVIPETVGQYVGLDDKNGKGVFEGDIVKVYDVYCNETVVGVVEFCDGSFRIYDKDFTSYDRWMYYEVEVIGNIHDNPEFLKGSAKK